MLTRERTEQGINTITEGATGSGGFGVCKGCKRCGGKGFESSGRYVRV